MIKISYNTLFELGASSCKIDDETDDPKTEEEFKKLQYVCDKEITWEEYRSKYKEVQYKTGITYLRQYRNLLLNDTDWIMTVDVFNTLTNKDEWTQYRKSLRDITKNPPPFVWINNQLDFKKMDIPKQPPILRESVN